MIQRIQTVFLLIATMLLIFVVSFPIAEFVRNSDQAIFELGFKGLLEVSTDGTIEFYSLPLSILIALCLAITVFSIFLYKKRIFQIRISVANIILLIGLQGLMYYYVRAAQLALPAASVSYKIFFIFPLVAAILVFLALRGIARDEALIRSLDRLR